MPKIMAVSNAVCKLATSIPGITRATSKTAKALNKIREMMYNMVWKQNRP